MRTFNALVYEQTVVNVRGSGSFSATMTAEYLGDPDQLVLHVICDSVSGATPYITVAIEHSSDGINFVRKNAVPELQAQALNPSVTNSFIVSDVGTSPFAAYARLAVTVEGTAHVTIWATGRRTVPPAWLPSVEAGLMLWLRGDAGVTASSGTISAWADQSGNGNDAVQATAPNQPTTGAGINGRATIEFDGTNSFLALPASIGGLSGACTIAVVCKMSSPPGPGVFYCVFGLISTGPTYGALYFINGGGYTNTSLRFGYSALANSVGHNDTLGASKTTRVVTYNGSGDSAPGNYRSTIDGVAQTVIASAGFSTSASLHAIGSDSDVAASSPFAGSIGEVILWDHALDAATLANLNTYLVGRWG